MAILLVPVTAAGVTGDLQINNSNALGNVSGLNYVPGSGVLNVPGDLNINTGSGFTTTLQMETPTADRTISFPDATGTVALIAGSNGQVLFNSAGRVGAISTLTTDGSGNVNLAARFTNGYTSQSSAPALTVSGFWFAAGTTTTTKPHLLIEPAGATSTGWTTSGTALGVNSPSGFNGRLLDLQANGTSKWHISAAGYVMTTQVNPTAVNTTATLTIASIQTGIITTTTAAAVDMTLPSGVLMDGGFTAPSTDMALDWSIINTGPNLASILATGGHTIVGAAGVTTGTSGRFRSRRTGAATWVTYRI